jgi:hypothetical protein
VLSVSKATVRNVVKPDRRPKTCAGYEGMVRLHIVPALGKKRLGSLTAAEVRAFLSSMTARKNLAADGPAGARGAAECAGAGCA